MSKKFTLNIAATLIVVLILSLLAMPSCGKGQPSSQDVVDRVSNTMANFNFVHKEIEEFLIDLKDKNVLTGYPLRAFQGISAELAPVAIKLNEQWMTVPDTAESIEAFILTPDFQNGVRLIAEMSKLAVSLGFNKPEVQTTIQTLKR